MNINEPTRGKALALPFTKAADPTHAGNPHDLRLPFSHRIPDGIRNHFIAMCGEYVGTVLFLFFALSGCQTANMIRSSAGLTVEETGANPQQLQYIALSFGFSLAVNAWVFFRISGGLFNPAVTFGMCLIGALPWLRGFLLFIVQILGGLTAAALVSCMFPGPLAVQTSLGGGTTVVQGLFIEMMLTAELIFTIFMLAAEKHKGTFIAPIGIGLALFVAELTGVYFTGGSLNPARSFGPAVVNRNFHSYHWIYWVGPILGAIVAAGFYKFIKILEYETANPDQDATEAHIKRLQNGDIQPVTNEEKALVESHNATNNTNEHKNGYSNGNMNGDAKANCNDLAYASGGEVVQGASYNSVNGHRPALNVRQPSMKPRLESPAMATTDEAFSGLQAGGMHGNELGRYNGETGAGIGASRTISGIV